MIEPRAAFDHHMMGIALRMAERALGTTAPNPAVGAVIVDRLTGELIARGWTQPGGRPHAEQHALAQAGSRARGAVMYLTLEPCANTGRTPTCSDAIQRAGLSRVVCAIADPNPIIAGRGFAQLRKAGVVVEVGLRAEEAHWITLGHILRQVAARPFVQIKMALDANLAVAVGNGQPVWVTSPEACAFGHRLRASVDAILVGSGTVLADDPALTCRLPGLLSRSPQRIVLDGRLRVPQSARIFDEGGPDGPRPAWIATRANEADFHARFGRAIRRIPIDDELPEGDPRALIGVLLVLAESGLTRLLVEGGPTVWNAFLAAGLVDEAVVLVSPKPSEGPTIPVLYGEVESSLKTFDLEPAFRGRIGPDSLIVLRRTQR